MRSRRTKKIIRLAETGKGRVFLHFDCIGDVVYASCMSIDGVTITRGDPEILYCPSPDFYNKFDVVATIDGAETFPSTTITTRLNLEGRSLLKRLYDSNCPLNISVHFGDCDIASDFYGFEKFYMLYNAFVTNYSLSNLVALQASDRSAIEESIDVTFEKLIEYNVVDELIETRIEDTTLNSIAVLRDDLCDICISCPCTDLALATDGLQNVLVAYEDDRDVLVFINSGGVVQTISAKEYKENQTVAVTLSFLLPITVGETITVGDYRLVGSSLGQVFYIDNGCRAVLVLDTDGDGITSLFHQRNCEFLVGTENGALYFGLTADTITEITSPTTLPISAVTSCDGILLVGDTAGDLFYSLDDGDSWSELECFSFNGSILSIGCCECWQVYVGTENGLYYSLDSMNTFKVLHDDYTNYKKIVCCPSTNEPLFLAEDGDDSIILSTGTEFR